MKDWLIGGCGVSTFQNYRWWAENGLARWEHKDSGNYGTIPVRKALEHLRGLHDMVTNSILESHESGLKLMYTDEIEKLQKFIDEMIVICKKAREQGTPDDESAGRDLRRRRKKLFAVTPTARNTF